MAYKLSIQRQSFIVHLHFLFANNLLPVFICQGLQDSFQIAAVSTKTNYEVNFTTEILLKTAVDAIKIHLLITILY